MPLIRNASLQMISAGSNLKISSRTFAILCSVKVKGRLDGTLSQDGELNPDSVARAVGKENKSEFGIPSVVEMRPPALCEGCGHRDMYITLTEVLKEEYPSHKVFSDIGCYTLGANAPFNAINSCVDMGASITMAKGAADGGLFPAVAVIGDSTFTHSGMTGLLDCVNENASVTIVISDNETTAMTGGQDSAGTGRIAVSAPFAKCGRAHFYDRRTPEV